MSARKLGWGLVAGLMLLTSPAWGQDETADPGSAPPTGADAPANPDEKQPTITEKAGAAVDTAKKKVGEAADATKKKAVELAEKVNESETGKKVSAGILDPIYKLAGALSLPGFHWIAFALIIAGVVSFAGQLVFGKLIMLSKLKISLLEIINDAICLAICLVALVLTTQAAAEHSTFTTTPALVLSATAVGVILGIVLMKRGVGQEVRASRGT